MLFLQLKTGEYMTIGDNVVVQLNDISGNRCKLMVEAPREVPVVRGELLERAGAERPECVMETARQRWSGSGISWNRNKSQALIAMRRLLCQMDGEDDRVKDLRRQLDFLFPPEFASNETIYAPKYRAAQRAAPSQSPAKRVWLGEEKQRNERAFPLAGKRVIWSLL